MTIDRPNDYQISLVHELCGLPQKDFLANPADCFIVSSTIMNEAQLLTADNKILNWKPSFKCFDAQT